MAKRIPEKDLEAIEDVVSRHSGVVTTEQIASELTAELRLRTLQYRLKYLVVAGRLEKEGTGRWTKYRLPPVQGRKEVIREGEAGIFLPLSKDGAEIREYLDQPPEARKPAGYNRAFLDSYRPGATAYLSPGERAHLAEVDRPPTVQQPAGTCAKQVLSRLLLDLL